MSWQGRCPTPRCRLLTTIALPPPADRSIADVWSALGGELKPSLDLVVTAPLDMNAPIPAAPPVMETPLFRMVRPDGTDDEVGTGSGKHVARSRGPLSHDDPANQEETVFARQAQGATDDDETSEGRSAKTKGKGKHAAEPPTPPSTAQLPGRRIIVRGVRRR